LANGKGTLSLEETRARPAVTLPAYRIEQLIDAGALLVDNGVVKYPGDGTLGALWQCWLGRRPKLRTKGDFDRYRRVGTITGGSGLPTSDGVINDLMEVTLPDRLTERVINGYLGPKQIKHVLERVRILSGEGRRGSKSAAHPGTVDDLLAIFPRELQPCLQAHLDRHQRRAGAHHGGAPPDRSLC
jgi:hypothetical protein